ncbi:MAG: winged helix-turn-helix domain-containing protein [Methanomassiliicoccus sp.]|nr:winged helix-turn-helix domain-containing protein [Methanomassiliicoccus sp.]
MASKVSKKECCDNVMNLPEEMEEAIQEVGGLDGLKGRIPERQELTAEGKLHQALSDPIRLQILHSLAVMDLCPCILKEITGLIDSKLSYHLNILEEEGLICSSPRHKWRIYYLTDRGKSKIPLP